MGRKSEHTLKVERAEFADKITHGVERERKKAFFLNSELLEWNTNVFSRPC